MAKSAGIKNVKIKDVALELDSLSLHASLCFGAIHSLGLSFLMSMEGMLSEPISEGLLLEQCLLCNSNLKS